MSELNDFMKSDKADAIVSETDNSKTTAALIMGASHEDMRTKTLDMAREMGMPEEEIEQLQEKLSQMADKFAAGTPRLFGMYSHPAVLGFTNNKDALEAMNARLIDPLKKDPEIAVALPVKHLVEAIETFKGASSHARRNGMEEQARVAEFGLLLMMWCAGFFGAKNINPKEILTRMSALWAGIGPGELEFRPVFDEDYAGVSSAWLDYKEGRIDGKEFHARCTKLKPVVGRGDPSNTCNCDNCKAARGEA